MAVLSQKLFELFVRSFYEKSVPLNCEKMPRSLTESASLSKRKCVTLWERMRHSVFLNISRVLR